MADWTDAELERAWKRSQQAATLGQSDAVARPVPSRYSDAVLRQAWNTVQTQEDNKQPSWGKAAYQVGKSALGGLAGLLDLAQMPLTALSPAHLMLPSQPTYSELLNRASGYVAPKLFGAGSVNEEGDVVTGRAADVAKAAVEGSVFPVGGPVANTLSAVGSEVASQQFPESKAAPFLGSLFGPASAAVGGKVAKGVTKAGRAFERASVGASKRDYLRNLRREGLYTQEETGEIATRLKTAINEIGKSDGWGIIRTPEKLYSRVTDKLSEYGGMIRAMVKKADLKGVSPPLSFTKTEKMISEATASRPALRKWFDEFQAALTDPVDGWDGTVSNLHKWSRDIRNFAFSGAADDQTSANLTRKLQRAIGEDMQRAIKAAAVKGGAGADEVERAFHKFGTYETVRPVIADELVGEEGTTAAQLLRAALKTTGGFLTTPTLIGGASGLAAGGPVGLLAGLALGAATSPTGSGLLGRLFKPASRVAGATLGRASAALPGALVSAFRRAYEGATGEGAEPAEEIGLEIEGDEMGDYDDVLSELLPRVIRAESAGDAAAKSAKGALGLMQIMTDTWKEWAPKVGVGDADPLDPEANRKVGAAYLGWLLDQFKGDPALALAAYNAGIGRVKGILEKSGQDKARFYAALPQETQKYLQTILGGAG